MIAWGSSNSVPLPPTDHARVAQALTGYDWQQAFPGAAVVALQSDAQRMDLQQKLTAASKELGNHVFVLISPPMQPGTGVYLGYLPSTLWEPINKKVT